MMEVYLSTSRRSLWYPKGDKRSFYKWGSIWDQRVRRVVSDSMQGAYIGKKLNKIRI